MQGIIGAFLGFLISFLISILLLNQPGAFEKLSGLVKQPIYLLFIILASFAGLITGYLVKTGGSALNRKKKENEQTNKDKDVPITRFTGMLADTIVMVAVIVFAAIAYLNSKANWIIYAFVLPVLIIWILYRSGVFSKRSDKSLKK